MKPETVSTDANTFRFGRWLRHRKLWVAGSALVVSLVVVSCVSTNQSLVIPSQIPGATFIGSEDCMICHDQITQGFTAGADHALLKVNSPNAINVGCEACHGPGSVHSDAGGGRGNIVNPRKSPEICFQCHLDKRGQFQNMPYHHQVLEGRMSCSDCHNPHQGSLLGHRGTSTDSIDALCFDCHIEQRGPFVFQHEAMREGCTTCHDPHGSVNAKLLRQRNANLCLKCHFQQRTASGILIGDIPHQDFLARGTCWTAGCHEAVHGSQVSPSLHY